MRRIVVIAGTAVLALIVLGAAALAFHDALAAAIIRAVAGGAGYNVDFGRLQVGFTGATATGTTVTNRTGEPVFSAGRIDVRYSIRYVLPGSGRRRFGIEALDIQRPTLTLIHDADGSYNVALPANATGAKPDTTPIDLRLRVRDGSVLLLDRFIVPGQERRQRIVGLAADAVLAPHAHSFYNVRFDFDDGHALHPVIGKATFALDRGYEAQRWTAADVPIGPVLNFALPSHAVNIVDGDLRNLDGRIYTFVDTDGTTHPHATVRADLSGGKIYIEGLIKPLRDAHGTLSAYDNGVTTRGVDATLAGVPLHLAGGLYGLGAPQLRFALTGGGQLAQLQQAIAPSQRQPITGDLSFGVRVLGSLAAPFVSGTFAAPRIAYRGFPADGAGGTFSIHGRDLDVLGAHFTYGPVNVEAHGTVALEKDVRTNLVVALHANGDRLPYVAQLVRGLPLTSVVHVAGTGTHLASDGIVYGDSRDGRLDAIFDVDGNGDGSIGPFSIERNDGASLYARVALDRTKASVLAIADAHRFTLLPAAPAALPGIARGTLPPLAGALDAQLVASVDASRLDGLSGHLRLTGLRYGALTADASADLGTAADGTQRGDVHVRSSLGILDGNAAYAGGLVGFDGRLRSSFAQLHGFTAGIDAHGGIDGDVRILTDGASSAVQTDDLQLDDASIAGIPLRSLTATATLAGERLDVRALQARIAGGTVTVQGTLGQTSGDELLATTSALALPAPAGGTVRANARVRGTLRAPSVNVTALVDRAHVDGIGVAGNAFAHYERGTLQLHDATALALDSYATAAGDVRGLDGGGAKTIDITADLHGAQIAPLAKALRLPLRYPEGELDADLHATGLANAPQLAGSVRIPRGSLNGLNFSNAGVTIAGDRNEFAARNGSVTVGTTAIAFSGNLTRSAQRVVLRAPTVDLADFNDYFNAADTLGGHGHILARAVHTGATVNANGDVLIEDARYRRFNAGTVAAGWQTNGRTVHGTGSIQTDHGSLALTTDLSLPAADPLFDLRHRATFSAGATLAGLDLAQWLPAAGVTQPVLGIVSGSAHASGTLAAPEFDTTLSASNALVRGYPLSEFTLDVSGNGAGARLSALHVAGPGLTADASGAFGYGAHDPLALNLFAQSADVSVLAKSLGYKLDIGGALSTTIDLTGSRSVPQLAQTLDATDLRSGKYTLPKLHAQLTADQQTVHLETFEADLVRGRAIASGTFPIRFTLPDAPFSATLRAEGIDLTQFAMLLPENTKLGGTLDGQIAASGTSNNPVVNGTLTLAGGSYSSNLVRSALSNGRARLDFTRSEARLTGVHADIGGGVIDGSGDATFTSFRDLQHGLAYNGAFTAQHVVFDVANLFRGTIDGTLAAQKSPDAIPTLSGSIAFSKARLPLAALIPRAPANEGARVPPTVAFNLNVQVGNDVRVTGPGVDIGARGALAISGNLAHPELDGRITSTGGTLSFYRTFSLRSGTVAFEPADGLVPDINATATTSISNPDTNITLQVTGPATNLNLDLSSSPSYSREQILGLLVNAQALGAVPGIETTGAGPNLSASAIAGGLLSQEFTQTLLQPLGRGVGQALGFQYFTLGYDFNTGVSAGARTQISKNLYATYDQDFGGNNRQVFGLNYTLPRNGALALSIFNGGSQTQTILATHQLFAPPDTTNFTLQALQPPPGQSGFVLTYQKKFR